MPERLLLKVEIVRLLILTFRLFDGAGHFAWPQTPTRQMKGRAMTTPVKIFPRMIRILTLILNMRIKEAEQNVAQILGQQGSFRFPGYDYLREAQEVEKRFRTLKHTLNEFPEVVELNLDEPVYVDFMTDEIFSMCRLMAWYWGTHGKPRVLIPGAETKQDVSTFDYQLSSFLLAFKKVSDPADYEELRRDLFDISSRHSGSQN